ncbi:UDP-glucose 4-epimerase [Hydrogenimonas sp.]|nr:UDP-glucose 4-epimerase [Hydrogenimonas sp.]
MNVAVTGASGFIGKYVVSHFGKKYNVIALARKKEKTNCYNYFMTDYSKSSLQALLKDCNALIHLAASRPISGNDDFFNNVRIDMNLFATAYEMGIENIIFVSSRSVYGSSPAPWKETTPPKPKNLYALAKLQSEAAAKFYNDKGMKIKILRIAQVFGIGEYAQSAIATFINHASEGKPLIVSVKGVQREYIYIKDLVDAFEKALLASDRKGIFNVGSGEIVDIPDMASSIAKAFDRTDLVKISEEIKYLTEYSLMDSSLFYKTFQWYPRYTFDMASLDVANNYGKSLQ